MRQLANTLNRRDEGKLPSQVVNNPKGQNNLRVERHNHGKVHTVSTKLTTREEEVVWFKTHKCLVSTFILSRNPNYIPIHSKHTYR